MMSQSLSILAVTNMYPTDTHPTLGVFVEQQVKGLREIGMEVEVYYVDRVGKGRGAYYQMLRPLRRIVRETRPHLLHIMYGGVMADRLTRWNVQCPKIVTFHGTDLLGEEASPGWRRCIARYGVLCSHRAARNADGVIVVAQRLKRALPAGLDESKVRVIPCGIDLHQFIPMDQPSCQRQLGWRESCFHVLFPSNNGDPVKRPGLAAAAVAQLKRAGVCAELHLMHGVPYPEVPVWMNASDVLIVTSLHEGSPTVVKEALACRVPVVSVDVGDVAERIAGIPGCHLALPESADLAAKLRLVHEANCRLSAPDRVRELGIRTIALKLEAFYRDTLSRWSGCRKSRGGRCHDWTSVTAGDDSIIGANLHVG